MRGVARIRQASLAAILGEGTRAGSFADGGMAGAEIAWGASGGHVHGGAPPPVVNWRRDITAAPGAETGPLLT